MIRLFKNVGFIREHCSRRVNGFGLLGCEAMNESHFYLDWGLRQIILHLRSTKYTRAIHAGVGLAPARAWLSVKADIRGRSCFSAHIYFPFARFDGTPLLGSRFPLGRATVAYHPQNNVLPQ